MNSATRTSPKGSSSRAAGWLRLNRDDARSRSLETRDSVVWGVVLLADCALRLIGAVTLPVSTMA